jgi:hypothetical protein
VVGLASQPDSSINIKSIRDGDAVPGCHLSDDSPSTPTGSCPGPREANAGSEDGFENLMLNGHTFWEDCRLPRFVIVLPRGKRKRL